jgi:hypothetical protein
MKKPDWLRVKLPIGEVIKVRSLVDMNKLHTICESGNCPNMGDVSAAQLLLDKEYLYPERGSVRLQPKAWNLIGTSPNV